MDLVDNVLAHHGIKGMRWGIRRVRTPAGSSSKASTSGHETSDDAAKALELATRARTSGTHTLSNQELQHLTKRMNLEQQYSTLTSKNSGKVSAGAKVAKEILVNVGKQQATQILVKKSTQILPKVLR